MTFLQVMPDSGESVLLRVRDPQRIAAELASLGLAYEQCRPGRALDATAGQEEVLAAYRDDVERLKQRGGYELVDVVRMVPDPGNSEWEATARAAREKFLSEHRHDEDEVRLFVEGRGCFYLHIEDKVYAVVCEAGDLLSVPVGTKHWFDMGTVPRFCAIRFFQKPDGWVGDFTGDPVATRIPALDELLAQVEQPVA
jgi:1,2-dihydroxy-3-keto-5-methylthiopentene dioxygenase